MAGNLEFINSFEITGSTSAFSCDNVFSDKYDVYNIIASGISLVGTTQTNLSMRLIDNTGSVISGANDYAFASLGMSSNTTFSEYKDGSGSLILNAFGKDDGIEGSSSSIYVHNPNDSSSYTFVQWQAGGDNGTALEGYKGIGVYPTAETIRGFQLLETATRPFDEGTISVYGVK
jgi:hypothetical protein